MRRSLAIPKTAGPSHVPIPVRISPPTPGSGGPQAAGPIGSCRSPPRTRRRSSCSPPLYFLATTMQPKSHSKSHSIFISTLDGFFSILALRIAHKFYQNHPMSIQSGCSVLGSVFSSILHPETGPSGRKPRPLSLYRPVYTYVSNDLYRFPCRDAHRPFRARLRFCVQKRPE